MVKKIREMENSHNINIFVSCSRTTVDQLYSHKLSHIVECIINCMLPHYSHTSSQALDVSIKHGNETEIAKRGCECMDDKKAEGRMEIIKCYLLTHLYVRD